MLRSDHLIDQGHVPIQNKRIVRFLPSPNFPASTAIRWDCPQVSVGGRPILQRTVLLNIACMESSIHLLNPLATTTIRADTDATWVGLNSDTSLIPDSAIVFRNLPDPGWSVDDFSDSGQTLPFDNARDPDWYRFDEQWAPWTPTLFLSQQRLWYDLLETAVPVEEQNGGWSMAEIQHQECSLDLTQVQACIRYVIDFDERVSRRMTVPGVFPTRRLAEVYPTQKLIQINAAKAKRSVLHSIGWLAWWTTIIVN